jgi:hypothetical protein
MSCPRTTRRVHLNHPLTQTQQTKLSRLLEVKNLISFQSAASQATSAADALWKPRVGRSRILLNRNWVKPRTPRRHWLSISMAETEDEMSDAGLNFTTRSRLLSWNQKQLRELAREGEERAFIDLTTAHFNHAVSQNIPQNWLLEGKCWLRWTFGTEVYYLDPDRYLDIRDWSDPQLERLLQQLRDGDVLVEAVNDKEIAAAKFVNALNVSGLNSSKASQKRYRAPDRLKERLVQTIGTRIAPPQTIESEHVVHTPVCYGQ